MHEKCEGMGELNGDEIMLTTPDGKMQVGDIVQFVPFCNFLKEGMNLQSVKFKKAQTAQYPGLPSCHPRSLA